MNPIIPLLFLFAYFGLLFVIARKTSKSTQKDAFFTGERNSPWFLVAFGMIGASLSGVTFVSVPGEVNQSYFYYMQVVVGYAIGYVVIASVLLPLYYKLNLISIYSYLENRFGAYSYKTGAVFFLISRLLGSSIRVLLAAGVLQFILFDALGIPFVVTVFITVLLIWLYTRIGGIKTIVWTDTLQTAFMLLAVILTLVYLISDLDFTSAGGLLSFFKNEPRFTFMDTDWRSGTFFIKQIISGAFITIVMTGLDQDMMQKNLTCRSLSDAKKNMAWFTVILVIVNFLFLSLGLLLYVYAEQHGIELPTRGDEVFPFLAMNYFPAFAGILFILGITAAAYSSADSTLTALTTSFCYDILNFEKRYPIEKQDKIRKQIHFMFTMFMFFLIILFRWMNDQSIIKTVLTVAGYTYGPLLGLFAFGLLTQRKVKELFVPFIAVLAPILSFVLSQNSVDWLWGYSFGFEILLVNGILMFLGLWLIREK